MLQNFFTFGHLSRYPFVIKRVYVFRILRVRYVRG